MVVVGASCTTARKGLPCPCMHCIAEREVWYAAYYSMYPHTCGDTTHRSCEGNCECDGLECSLK